MAGRADYRERVKLRVKDRERLREIIRVEDLIGRVQEFALAEPMRGDDGALTLPDEVRMSGDQLSAARMMLAKVLPDLAAVEIAPDPEAAVILPEPLTPQAWAAAHARATTETVQ